MSARTATTTTCTHTGPGTHDCACIYGYGGDGHTCTQQGTTRCLPDCTLEVHCPALPEVEGATITLSNGNIAPSTATYTCDGGGPPQDGDATRTCQADGSWSGTAPTSCCTSFCSSGSQILNAQMQSQMDTWLSEEGISATRWELCYSSLRGDSTGAASAFHSMCDSHPRTISIARQGGYIFGGYIQRTRNEKQNGCGDSAPNWLFRMAPDMTKYPHLTNYWSRCANSYWPTWGGGYCLTMGNGGALGHTAYCSAHFSCPGVPEDFCGGDQNWGGTQLEVFYAV